MLVLVAIGTLMWKRHDGAGRSAPVRAASGLAPRTSTSARGRIESYELAAYFYSRTNCVWLAQGSGKKGYCFFVGDEGYYPTVDKATIRRVIGDEVPADITAVEAFRRLHEKFHAFFTCT